MDESLEDIDWGAVYKKVRVYAARRTGGDEALAEDLLQQAIADLFDPSKVDWDPKERSLAQDLGSRVNGLLSNLRKKQQRRDEKRADVPKGWESGSPEDRVLAQDEARQVTDALLEAIADDDMATQVLIAMSEDEKPAETAARLSVPINDVYNARRRLQGHAAKIRATMEDS